VKQLSLFIVAASAFLFGSTLWFDLTARADAWEGVWAFEKEWCQYPDQIGEHDPAPIRVTRNEFVGLENWCTVTHLKALAEETVLDLACEGEGETYSDRVYLRIEGNSLKIHRIGEEPRLYHRCE